MGILDINNFKTVLNDDFTKDTALNTAIWGTAWGNAGQTELTGADGLLLQASKSDNWNPVGIQQSPSGRAAGEGYGLYSFTGKASVAGQGSGICFLMWRADNLWLNSAQPGLLTEIDVLESWDGLKTVQATDHYYQNAAHPDGQSLHSFTGINLTQFHTFAMDWEPGSLTYYVDGNEMFQINGVSVPKDYADGGVNYTLGAEVTGESLNVITSTVGLYVKDISYSVALTHTTTLSGSGTIAALTAGETLYDTGSGNTLVFPGTGAVTLSGNTTRNADIFDLRAVMAKTNWNGDAGTIGQYFSATPVDGGVDLQIRLHSSGGAASTPLATLDSVGGDSGALARFEQHALLTVAPGAASSPVFISGPGVTTTLAGNETLYDMGYGNTLVFPSAGGVTLSGNVVNNGDTFDLRAAMTRTHWDGKSADLGNYVSASRSSNGQDLLVLIKQTPQSASMVLATIKNVPGLASAFANFETHAIF